MSHHEPDPKMIGNYLSMVNRAPYASHFEERRIKSLAIKRILAAYPAGRIYSETSHMFIKTFFDVIMEDFDNVEVIALRRELAAVLKSFIEMGYFSSMNETWPFWMSSANAVTAALPCIDDDEKLDQYDLSIAYLFDIEARAARFQAEYPAAATHQVRVEALNSHKNVVGLFNDLGITPTDRTRSLTGKAVNLRTKRKRHFARKIELEYCRTRIDRYLEIAGSKGINVPESLALEPYRE